MTAIISSVILIALFSLKAFCADYTVTVNADTVLFTLDTIYHGVNYVGFWDNAQGSAGSREALRRAGVRLIRFPGGEPGNWYDWNQQSTWTSTTMASLRDYADAVGAKLMLQTNPTYNNINDAGDKNDPSAAHAAAWVTYCRDNNVPAPFWEIGNEPESDNNWQQADWDSTKLRWYYNRFNEQAPAMKVADASIKVMGPVAANAWYWWGCHDLAMFLHFCNANTDAVSIHWYPYGNQYPGWDNIRGLAQSWQSNMDYIRTVTQKPVYITEWSAHGSNAGSLQMALALALSSADMIGAFAKSGVAGHCWFGTIHNVNGGQWGFLYGANEAKPQDTPAASYYILPLWSRMGNLVLNVASNADATNKLSAYAHKKSDGSVQVMLINKDSSSNVTIAFNGYSPAGTDVVVSELKPKAGGVWDADIFYNGTENPNASTQDLPAPAMQACSGPSFIRALPAYSITVLEFSRPSRIAGTALPCRNLGSLKTGKILVVNGCLLAGHPLLAGNRPIGVYTIQGKRVDLKPGMPSKNAVYIIRDETPRR